MHRRFVHAAAWILATAAAVALSWFGVRTVLDSTSDRPHVMPVSGEALTESPAASPSAEPSDPSSDSSSGPSSDSSESSSESSSGAVGTSSQRPAPPAGSPSPSRTGGSAGTPSATAPSQPAAGEVKSYTVAGGRVVFELRSADAELVSATPESGWQMETWEEQKWIRVDFIRGDRRTSVICSWHNHPPLVETNENAQ